MSSNPYQSLNESSPQPNAEGEPPQPLPPHFTLITVNGCNLLGLANVFTLIGGVFLSTEFHSSSVWVGRIVLGLALLICIAFDVAYRLFASRQHVMARLLSPHVGGALLFIPVWFIDVAGIVSIAALVPSR